MKDRSPLQSRRQWLKTTGCGFGGLALTALSAQEYAPESHRKRERPRRPEDHSGKTGPHLPPRAKRVIFLFMPGGPSQFDTFDHKPDLAKALKPKEGAKRGRGPRMPSPFEFQRYGQSGLPISEVFSNVAQHADDLCLLNAMETSSNSHSSAETSLHNGRGRGRSEYELPSLGAWTYYGLGNSSNALPGYLTINYGGGAKNFGSGFLPSKYQGMRMEIGQQRRRFFGEAGSGGTANVGNRHYTVRGQRRQMDFVQSLNQDYVETLGGSDKVEAVIESFERGFDLQDTFQAMLDATNADALETKLYGLDESHTAGFGQQCLIARRMAEQGVPFIQLNHTGARSRLDWDHHGNLDKFLPESAAGVDKPIAGLLSDLNQRGMLDETLVVWGGEFGRTWYGRNGRGHQNRGFTMWMAGGGVKGGIRHGATDAHGTEIEHGKVTINDLHATILHQLGIDAAKLVFKQNSRELFSEAKNGKVVRDVLV